MEGYGPKGRCVISVQLWAESAYAAPCRSGNPRKTSAEEIVALYKSQM